MNNNNYVAIMAGGVGTRFWPMSRSGYPKQFLDILGTGKTLLQSTFERFKAFMPVHQIYIVTAQEYVSIVREQLPELPATNILGEPSRKNTAPCIAYVAFKLRELNPHANLIVAPSDHLIEDSFAFKNDCLKALKHTENNSDFVTMGIKPASPNTGYGYIQYDTQETNDSIFSVERFTEKPDATLARAFLESGDYLWNSGIFIWKVRDILQAFKDYMPDMYRQFFQVKDHLNGPYENEVLDLVFKKCESISIDYGIMEHAENVKVIPANFDWDDLGTWNSAWEKFEKDDQANAIKGNNVLAHDSQGCLVQSDNKRLIVIGGLQDLIVVDTPDALLVCHKDQEQQIKQYVNNINQTIGSGYL
jgi:mannose-1-phosphate guanylyltransferase